MFLSLPPRCLYDDISLSNPKVSNEDTRPWFSSTEYTLLSNNINDYHFVSQGKTSIPGVDDGEEFIITDVSAYTVSKQPRHLCIFITITHFVHITPSSEPNFGMVFQSQAFCNRSGSQYSNFWAAVERPVKRHDFKSQSDVRILGPAQISKFLTLKVRF